MELRSRSLSYPLEQGVPFCPVTQGFDTGRSTSRSVKSAVGGATVSKGNITDEFDPLTGVNVDSTPVLKPTLSDVRTTQHRILYTGGSAEMLGSLAPGERLSVEPDSLFNVDEICLLYTSDAADE